SQAGRRFSRICDGLGARRGAVCDGRAAVCEVWAGATTRREEVGLRPSVFCFAECSGRRRLAGRAECNDPVASEGAGGLGPGRAKESENKRRKVRKRLGYRSRQVTKKSGREALTEATNKRPDLDVRTHLGLQRGGVTDQLHQPLGTGQQEMTGRRFAETNPAIVQEQIAGQAERNVQQEQAGKAQEGANFVLPVGGKPGTLSKREKHRAGKGEIDKRKRILLVREIGGPETVYGRGHSPEDQTEPRRADLNGPVGGLLSGRGRVARGRCGCRNRWLRSRLGALGSRVQRHCGSRCRRGARRWVQPRA